MLYNPNWDTTTKADPFTLASLIAWLETMPDEGYDYRCNGACLLARYFASAGFENVHMFTTGFLAANHPSPSWDRIIPMNPVFDSIATGYPRTFGAALERARTI